MIRPSLGTNTSLEVTPTSLFFQARMPGCQAPCECAIWSQPTYGSFQLVPAGFRGRTEDAIGGRAAGAGHICASPRRPQSFHDSCWMLGASDSLPGLPSSWPPATSSCFRPPSRQAAPRPGPA